MTKDTIINQRTNTEFTPYLATGIAEGFEEPTSAEQSIEAWAYLIATGMAWSLQGGFGRTASIFIDEGLIDKEGVINWELVDERLENN